MRWCAVVLGLAMAGCAAGMAEVKPLIDACKVARIEYVRAGTFVVEKAQPRERRIEYGGDSDALVRAIAEARPRCGDVPTLRE